MWLRRSIFSVTAIGPHRVHQPEAMVTWLASLAVALAIGPFVAKRFILLGEHGYGTWLTIDYMARCVSLVGIVLGFRSGLLVRSTPRAGVVVCLFVLLVLVTAELAEQAVVYPILRHYLRILELYSTPLIPDAHVRAADLLLGLVLVAVSEELVFRRFLFALLERWCKKGLTIILMSSTIFALIHFTSGIADTLNAFVHGMLLGSAFWKTRRVSVCIASHYLVDLWIFAR